MTVKRVRSSLIAFGWLAIRAQQRAPDQPGRMVAPHQPRRERRGRLLPIFLDAIVALTMQDQRVEFTPLSAPRLERVPRTLSHSADTYSTFSSVVRSSNPGGGFGTGCVTTLSLAPVDPPGKALTYLQFEPSRA